MIGLDHIQSSPPIPLRFTSTFLPLGFLISIFFGQTPPVCPICVAQLFLGVGPVLKCVNQPKASSLKETDAPLPEAFKCQQILVLKWDFMSTYTYHSEVCLAWSCTDLVCVVPTTVGSHMQLCYFIQECDFFLWSYPPPMVLTIFLYCLQQRALTLWLQGVWALCNVLFFKYWLRMVLCLNCLLLKEAFLMRLKRIAIFIP